MTGRRTDRLELTIADHPASVQITGVKRAPRKFSRVAIPFEQKVFALRMANKTFLDMVNQGHTMQEALCAVYLTGIDHGLNGGRTQDEA